MTDQIEVENPVTNRELQRFLLANLLARRVPMIWGSPGIGKSDGVREVLRHMATRYRGVMRLTELRGSQIDAVDTKGLPTIGVRDSGTKTTQWAVPDFLPSHEEAAKVAVWILFLDELTSATPAVQAALYQLVLDRRLGDYVLPDNVRIIAAGNLDSDRAVTHKMSTALANRMTHATLTVSAADWVEWAYTFNGANPDDHSEPCGADTLPAFPVNPYDVIPRYIHPVSTSFVEWRPELLHMFDPRSHRKAQATPRTHQYMSDLLHIHEYLGGEPRDLQVLATGTVGEQVASELLGFYQVCASLPDPDDVLADPSNAPVPNQASVLYALVSAIVNRACASNALQVVEYANRLQAHHYGEHASMLVRMSHKRDPGGFGSTGAFVQWAIANGAEDLLSA